MSLLALLAIWRGSRSGYVAAILVDVLLVVVFFTTRDGHDVVTVLLNPPRIIEFIFDLTNVLMFFAFVSFSALGPRKAIR